MATRILQGPVVKDRADRTDSTVAGDQLRGAGDIQELPEGVIRLSDPSVGATAGGGPAAVAWPIAHRGRVTWIDVRGEGRQGQTSLGGGRRRHPWAALSRASHDRRSCAVGESGGGRRPQGAVGRGGRGSRQGLLHPWTKTGYGRRVVVAADRRIAASGVGDHRPMAALSPGAEGHRRRRARGGEAVARRHRRLGAGVRGGCHSVARQREEPPWRVHGFGGPRGDGHGRFSRSRQIADNAPAPAVRTVAGSGRYSPDPWLRLLGGQRYRTGGPVEDRCAMD